MQAALAERAIVFETGNLDDSSSRSRTDIRGGHAGLAITLIALIAIAGVSGPRLALIVAGCFAAWFVLALVTIHLLAGRSGEPLRRAYVATFGWGDYVTP
ncbi:hypothetical protein [Streptomyces sp. NPDC048350]|uniref:hypothetical protein n=1 Tax=Streptomyces sp. NPDC048350 TaxID=3365538 RepID=UPI003722BD4C